MITIREIKEPDIYIYKGEHCICKTNNELTLLDALVQIKEGNLQDYYISIPECEIHRSPVDPNTGMFEGKTFIGSYEDLLKRKKISRILNIKI